MITYDFALLVHSPTEQLNNEPTLRFPDICGAVKFIGGARLWDFARAME